MNRYNFLQTGGLPFEADILDGMQKAYEIFNSLGALAGNFTIISGCIITGSTVSNGFVHINGEIYPFVGGTIQTNVVFQSVIQSVEFEDLTTKDIQEKKHVQFGTGVDSMLWADFKRPETTTQLTTLINDLIGRVETLEAQPTAFEVGMVLVWKKPENEIPAGWIEWIDMRGKMPLGLNPADPDFDSLGTTGGTKDVALVEDNLPRITLNYTKPAYSGNTDDSPGGGTPYYPPAAGTLTFGKVTPDKINKMNPYRIVHFIEYVGI